MQEEERVRYSGAALLLCWEQEVVPLEKQYRFFLLSHCPQQSVGISLAEYGVQRTEQLKNHTKQPVVKEKQGLGGKNLGTQRNRPPFGGNILKSRGSFKHLNLSRLHAFP